MSVHGWGLVVLRSSWRDLHARAGLRVDIDASEGGTSALRVRHLCNRLRSLLARALVLLLLRFRVQHFRVGFRCRCSCTYSFRCGCTLRVVALLLLLASRSSRLVIANQVVAVRRNRCWGRCAERGRSVSLLLPVWLRERVVAPDTIKRRKSSSFRT